MYTDTFIASEKSLVGNVCGHLFTTIFVYLRFVSLRKKGDAHIALSEVFQEVGLKTGINEDTTRELNLVQWK